MFGKLKKKMDRSMMRKEMFSLINTLKKGNQEQQIAIGISAGMAQRTFNYKFKGSSSFQALHISNQMEYLKKMERMAEVYRDERGDFGSAFGFLLHSFWVAALIEKDDQTANEVAVEVNRFISLADPILRGL